MAPVERFELPVRPTSLLPWVASTIIGFAACTGIGCCLRRPWRHRIALRFQKCNGLCDRLDKSPVELPCVPVAAFKKHIGCAIARAKLIGRLYPTAATPPFFGDYPLRYGVVISAQTLIHCTAIRSAADVAVRAYSSGLTFNHHHCDSLHLQCCRNLRKFLPRRI